MSAERAGRRGRTLWCMVACIALCGPARMVLAQDTAQVLGSVDSDGSDKGLGEHFGDALDGRPGGDHVGDHVGDDQSALEADDVTVAKTHFEEGRQLFRARRFREAIRAFELARALWPSPDLLFNIARAYEELGDYQVAVGYFERYLQRPVEPDDAAEVLQRIAVLKRRDRQLQKHRARGARVGALRLVARRPPQRVWLAKQPHPELAKGGQLWLPPGEYPLKVTWPGAVPFLGQVAVRAGEVTTAYPRLDPFTAPQLMDEPQPSAWFWSGVAATALALTAGAVLGTMAILEREESHAAARDLSLASDISLGSAFVLGVSSAILYLAEQP